MTIEYILEVLATPPLPANEVVALDRRTVERSLTMLESHPDVAQVGPSLCAEVCVIRQALAAPKVELWAMHSVGPGEVYPCLNKEDAERQAQELRDTGDKLKAERIARGESVKMWSDWVTDVIPSPWEPAEHFEIMAEEWQDNHRELADYTTTLQAERDELQAHVDEMTKMREAHGFESWAAVLVELGRLKGLTQAD